MEDAANYFLTRLHGLFCPDLHHVELTVFHGMHNQQQVGLNMQLYVAEHKRTHVPPPSSGIRNPIGVVQVRAGTDLQVRVVSPRGGQ